MNLKEFFKPTIAKIIVFIILFISFAPFISYDTGIRCVTIPCPSSATGSLIQYLLFSYDFYIYFPILYTNLIMGIIISYLISCALVSIIKKLRKRRNNEY